MGVWECHECDGEEETERETRGGGGGGADKQHESKTLYVLWFSLTIFMVWEAPIACRQWR